MWCAIAPRSRKLFCLSILLPAGILLAALPAHSEPLKLGPVEIGGAVRVNVFDKSWVDETKPRDYWDFDTAMLDVDFSHGNWEASAQYRLYYYADPDYSSHFLHHGWAGYRFSETDYVRAGVQKVPFGPLPFASHSYFFSIFYYLGLEDDYDLGLAYHTQQGAWSFDAAYFLSDEGNYHGKSNDSARYSYDIVSDMGRSNKEENQLTGRAAYQFDHAGLGVSEAGLSLLYGEIPNGATGETGSRVAAGLHWVGDFGPWNIITEAVYYDIDLKNPAGQDSRFVIMGAYDFPYQVASEAYVYSAGLSHSWKMSVLGLQGLTLYDDYSYMEKTASGFADTQQNVLGVSLDFEGPAFVYVDLLSGRNHAYASPDYGSAFGPGSADGGWQHRFNINVGFYF